MKNNQPGQLKDGAECKVIGGTQNGNRYERIEDLREVSSRGFDVLIFDYRGFGDSTGSPSETSLSSDALRASIADGCAVKKLSRGKWCVKIADSN